MGRRRPSDPAGRRRHLDCRQAPSVRRGPGHSKRRRHCPRVSGPILALPIEDNQQVEAGDILFEVDPEPFVIASAIAQANRDALVGEIANARGAIEAQRLQVDAARAVLSQVETALAQAEETYQRLAPLLEKRFTTPEAVDTARRARDTAAAGVSVAKAELEATRALIHDVEPLLARQRALSGLVEAAELALEHTVVRAPFPARVAALTISEGAFARTGFDTITLIDTRRWWVVADFRESELRHIQVGDRVRVTLATAPGLEVGGIVDGIDWGVTAMPQNLSPAYPSFCANSIGSISLSAFPCIFYSTPLPQQKSCVLAPPPPRPYSAMPAPRIE